MQKTLLITTAALGLLASSAPQVMAESAKSFGHTKNEKAPTISLSGEGIFHAMSFVQKQREANGGKGNGNHFTFGDSRLNVAVNGKADGWGELNYGLLLGLTMDKSETQSISEARLLLKGEWGTITMGNTRGVEYVMAVSPWAKVFDGTGGADGNFIDVVNRTSGTVISVQPLGRTRDATKINYFTPRVYGFQIGLTFTPNTRHHGEQRAFTKNNATDSAAASVEPFDKNSVAAVLGYKNKFSNGLDLAASFGGIWASSTQQNQALRDLPAGTFSKTGDRNRTKTWLTGIVLGYHGFEIGFEYIDNGKSRELGVLQNGDAGKIYNLGVAYTFGPDKFSLGYAHTVRNLGNRQGQQRLGKAKMHTYSIAWDRKLAPGLGIFLEGDYFKYDTDARLNNDAQTRDAFIQGSSGTSSQGDFVDNNRGHVAMAGVKMKF